MSEPRYAWVIVWAVFVCLGVIFGVNYSFAAFFQSFADEFKAERADIALIFGLSGLVHFSLGALAGMAADRFGPRLVTASGMLCIAAGLWATSLAHSMQAVYLGYGLTVGLGIALVYSPAIGCVQPWFTQRRGLAGGIASAGIGAGTLAVPLLAAWLIAGFQWRQGLQALAMGVLLVGVAASLLLRRAPLAVAAPGGVARPGESLRQALRNPRFWWLYAGVVAGAFPMFIPFAHVSVAARDLGIAEAQAVGLVGAIGIGSLTGRFAIGALADRIGRKRTLVLMQASMGLSYALWLAAGSYTSFLVFALWLGLSYGGIVSLLPALCMDMFGARAVAGIIGTLYTGAALGNLVGPVAAGAVFDQTGSYAPVLWGCMAASVLATLAAWRLMRLPGPSY